MLSAAEAAVIRVSGALAGRSHHRIRLALQEASAVADPVQVEEAILQSYLFLGYPAALNGFAIWREVSGRAADVASDEGDLATWTERGRAICRTVYGGQYERLRTNVRSLHADMEGWMIAEGYGKVLARPHLALEVRELCIVAMLTVLDAPKQLYSHLRGALNAGASAARVGEALGLVRDEAGEDRTQRAVKVWDRVQERRRGN